MILAIDCGNTRIKWGTHPGLPGGAWQARGSIDLDGLPALEAQWSGLAKPEAIVIANVAGPAIREAVARALQRFATVPTWASPRAEQCGVTNGYADPSQLGVDRWAALIGARSLHDGASVVVSAGTATTIDLLSATGTFLGGAIVPGLDLMKRSLAEGTAGLPLAQGRFAERPRTTADAIETGCLVAQAGAIERMYATCEPGAVCFLSGGAAERIAARLEVPVRIVDSLVLEGLVRMAAP